jgi:hypothetical protein
MGYHIKHVTNVDLMTRSIKTHIKNKQKFMIINIENLIKRCLKKKQNNILKIIRIKYMLENKSIESHANVVVLDHGFDIKTMVKSILKFFFNP